LAHLVGVLFGNRFALHAGILIEGEAHEPSEIPTHAASGKALLLWVRLRAQTPRDRLLREREAEETHTHTHTHRERERERERKRE
jgi:hypothetical protein